MSGTAAAASPGTPGLAAAYGTRLRSVRVSAALTEEEVACHAGLPVQSYRALEAGDPAALDLLSGDLLWRLTDALGSHPVTFLRGLHEPGEGTFPPPPTPWDSPTG